MAFYGKHPSFCRESPPSDDLVWRWFVAQGPHGLSFTWRKIEWERLRKVIEEYRDADEMFSEKARAIALEGLASDDPVLICKGLQVLSVLWNADDIDVIRERLSHPDEAVVQNARSCLFVNGLKK